MASGKGLAKLLGPLTAAASFVPGVGWLTRAGLYLGGALIADELSGNVVSATIGKLGDTTLQDFAVTDVAEYEDRQSVVTAGRIANDKYFNALHSNPVFAQALPRERESYRRTLFDDTYERLTDGL